MRKQLYGLMMLLIFMPVYAADSDDKRFNEMEAKGIFGKVKFNMIVSCYTNMKPTSKAVNLENLKARFPDRVAACTCFESELSKTSNRQIFDDSKRAYELNQERVKATQEKDTAKLIGISEKEKEFKPFMAVIVEKCGLNK